MKQLEKAAVDEVLESDNCLEPPMKLSNNVDHDPTTTKRPTSAQSLTSSMSGVPQDLPRVDIFLNPEKKGEVTSISTKKRAVAKTYFDSSNMTQLYPKLFQILWESTLPCLPGRNVLN